MGKNPTPSDEAGEEASEVVVERERVWVTRYDDESEEERVAMMSDVERAMLSMWERDDVVRDAVAVALRDDEVGRVTMSQCEAMRDDDATGWVSCWVEVVADDVWERDVVVYVAPPGVVDVASTMGEVEVDGREWEVTREVMSESEVDVATGAWQERVMGDDE